MVPELDMFSGVVLNPDPYDTNTDPKQKIKYPNQLSPSTPLSPVLWSRFKFDRLRFMQPAPLKN